MIILPADPHNIPGVTVLDPFLRIVAADSDYTPHTQRITKHLHRFGNALADTHALSQRSDNLMGIGLFQLIVGDIFADKVVNVLLFFPLCELCGRSCQLFHPGLHGFLMFSDLIFLKQILRHEDDVGGVLIISIPITHHPEDLRMIQPQSEKYVIQFFRRDPRQLDLVCQRQHSLLHSVIGGLLGLVHFLVVICFHSSFLFYCFHLSYFYILTEGFSFGWMFLIFF